MKEYLEINEEYDDSAIYPPEHLLTYVNDKVESQAILREWKKTTKATKWKAQHVITKHEEGLPCEAEQLEEMI